MLDNIDFFESDCSIGSKEAFLPYEEDKIINNNEEIIENLRRKRGRKTEGINNKKFKRKTHVKTDDDNILNKIQVHFMNFIVNVSNDAIKSTFKKGKEERRYCFKHINYNYKKNISYDYFEKLKSLQINKILKKPVSKKYKNFSEIENYNETVYNQVIKKSDWLKKFYDMIYIDLFKIYYNNAEKMDKISFNGQNIKFTKKTKSLFNLIQKYSDLKVYIISIIDTYYFNNIETKTNININKNNYFQVKKVKKK